ncbi:hypothetical protein [Chryseobacterium turcicum]|uniref:Uncharacterized protein n=1 Tax=Chryseobacterium turcicum TaxID=2898076 RepID=A0A9Q3V148_9FLAO|nr:hypothetical protein [Chryseobacterium turcicum]MCD1116422.1 hypothetical protein [Chryseobacterium turcicum]
MKCLIILLLVFSIKNYSQRKNYFPDSDKNPNCSLINNGSFNSDDKNTLKVKFHHNKMIEILGDKETITIESKLKMLDKCKFETEIISIKTKLELKDDLMYLGKKTEYKIVETGENYIILEYPCNDDRNTCTEILDKE